MVKGSCALNNILQLHRILDLNKKTHLRINRACLLSSVQVPATWQNTPLAVTNHG
jgi:hypothetical protein